MSGKREYWARINNTPISEMGFMIGANGVSISRDSPTVNSVKVPGLHGVIDTTLEDVTGRAMLGMVKVTVELLAVGTFETLEPLRAQIMRLHGCRGSFSYYATTIGEYRGRWSVKDMNEYKGNALSVTLTLTAYPWLYAHDKTIYMNNGYPAIYVEGSLPVYPRFVFQSVDTDRVTVTNNTSGKRLCFTNNNSHMRGTLTVDTRPSTRAYLLNDTPILPTIDSVAFTLNPGLNEISTPKGECELTYTPLILF